MARLVGLRGFPCATVAVVWVLSGRASPAETLRLVNDDYLGPSEDIADDKAPGFGVEVLRQVLAGLGHDVSFEIFPARRAWMMVISGGRDGMLATLRTSEGEQFFSGRAAGPG